MPRLSLVVPCYNEEDNIKIFYNTVQPVLTNFLPSYEIIFVNDGSTDHTYDKLSEVFLQDPQNVIVVTFSRNFGKEAAILAGLRQSHGELVCVIDADLQQRPETVLEMVKILDMDDSLDCVAAYQETRKESRLITLSKNIFYKIMNRISDTTFFMGASDFRTFRRPVVNAILSLPEYHRFSKGIFSWVGYKTEFIPYQVSERNAGKSKWSVSKLIKYALEGFISFSTFPLHISTFLGLFTSAMAILYLIVVLIQKLVFSINIPGYPTIIGLILLLGGVQLLILGILGEYLARIYIQVKGRPIYIEKEILSSTEGIHE